MDYTDRGILQQLFVDSLPGYALIILDVDGKVLTWNAGARDLFGYLEEEIVGRHFSCLYNLQDIAAATPLMSLAGALAQGRHEETGRRVRKDGTALDVEGVLIPVYDPQKKLIAFGNLIREVGRLARSAVADFAVDARFGSEESIPAEARRKILLVDDDKAVLSAAEGMLIDLGYQVLVASNGSDALGLLAGASDIELLFTDVVMPKGMSGGELAEEARQLQPGLKVLFASGYFEGALVRDRTIEASAEFIVKPYRKKELARKIEEVLKTKVLAQ